MSKPTDAHRIICKLAEKEGVSVDDVLADIELVIKTGMSSNDPDTRTRWQSIPRSGSAPTPEELLVYLVSQLHFGSGMPKSKVL